MPFVVIDLSAARRGEPCVFISGGPGGTMLPADAYELGRELQIAADFAEQLVAGIHDGVLKAVE